MRAAVLVSVGLQYAGGTAKASSRQGMGLDGVFDQDLPDLCTAGGFSPIGVEGIHAAPEGVGILLKLCNGLFPAGLFRGFWLIGSILRRSFRLTGLDLLHRRCRVRGIVLPKRHPLLDLRRSQAEDGG